MELLNGDELHYLDKFLARAIEKPYMEFESVFGITNRNFGFEKNRISRDDFQRVLKIYIQLMRIQQIKYIF